MKIHNRNLDAIVGGNLMMARRQAMVSQTELGKALGVSFQQVQKYEYGTNAIKASTLWKVAAMLGKDIGWFFETHTFSKPMTVAKQRVLAAAAKKAMKRGRAK